MREKWRRSSNLEDSGPRGAGGPTARPSDRSIGKQGAGVPAVSLHLGGCQTTVLQQGALDDRRPTEGTAWEPDFAVSNQHLWAAVVGIQEDPIWTTPNCASGERGNCCPDLKSASKIQNLGDSGAAMVCKVQAGTGRGSALQALGGRDLRAPCYGGYWGRRTLWVLQYGAVPEPWPHQRDGVRGS